jgi:integrase
LEETTQTRESNFLGAVLLSRRLKLPKGANLHSLCHTHTSHLLARGVPLPAMSARLGHASIRTTQDIYSHMIHGQDDEAAKKWEEFQSQPTGGSHSRRGACSEVVRD